MSGARAGSRKRHVGFAPILKVSCRLASETKSSFPGYLPND
jgi:hypothetical protein